MAANFDTHAAVKRLGAAGFDERQAEALAAAISEARTRADLVTRADLDKALAELKAELMRWMFGIAVAQVVLIAALVRLAA